VGAVEGCFRQHWLFRYRKIVRLSPQWQRSPEWRL